MALDDLTYSMRGSSSLPSRGYFTLVSGHLSPRIIAVAEKEYRKLSSSTEICSGHLQSQGRSSASRRRGKNDGTGREWRSSRLENFFLFGKGACALVHGGVS